PARDAHKEEELAVMRPGVLFGALSLLLTAGAASPIPATFPPSSRAFPPPTAAKPATPTASAKPDIGALLAAALPADGTTDVVLVDWPATPRTPHVPPPPTPNRHSSAST